MRQFSMLIKPASSLCNMRCKYCFYADVSDSRRVKSYGIMTGETARLLIDRALEAVGGRGRLHIAFQGGEPTLAGLDFFRAFTAYAAEKKPSGVRIEYAIQTNGQLLDEDWCRLLAKERFLVGLSFDGTPELHDFLRPDSKGAGTAKRVLQAAALMDAAGVDYNILTVVTRQAAKHPRQIFSYCQKRGFRFIQFIPCLPPFEGKEDAPFHDPFHAPSHALTPRLYAAFLKDMFRLWREALAKGEYISVRLFDNLVRLAGGGPPEQCGMLGFCQPQFVVEADGGVYPCDFYVLDAYRMGSVREKDFRELADSPALTDFLRPVEKNPLCGQCPCLKICGGGCRRYRDFYFSEAGYCPYRDFLTACWPDILKIARRLRL